MPNYPGDVPPEVFLKILSFINDPLDLQHLLLVSKEVAKAAHEFVWKNLRQLSLTIGQSWRRDGPWLVRLELNNRLIQHKANISLLEVLVNVRVLKISFWNGNGAGDTTEVVQLLEALIASGVDRGWKIQRLLINLQVGRHERIG